MKPAEAAKLRAWWWQQQGFDGSLAGARAAAVLARSGWARSVAGVGPYLTLFARAGIGRVETDAAVANVEIHELPAARACTYLVPASDYALALRIAQAAGDGELKVALALGVTEREIDRLCEKVLDAVASEPLSPDGIREATGNASRSLGEAGKKRGLTTTLPVALGRLQRLGEIRRIPEGGRLDQQRYAYARWKPSPLARDRTSVDDAQRALAQRFFRWVGPATLAELAWFAGIGKRAAATMGEALQLVPIAKGSERLLLADDVDAFHAFMPPKTPQYALTSSLDALTATRRNVEMLVDAADRKRAPGVDLPHHAIFDRGRLAGFWEYETASQSIVWACFGKKDKALVAAVKATEAYVRDELGDARSFSLDSPKSRAPAIAALRAFR